MIKIKMEHNIGRFITFSIDQTSILLNRIVYPVKSLFIPVHEPNLYEIFRSAFYRNTLKIHKNAFASGREKKNSGMVSYPALFSAFSVFFLLKTLYVFIKQNSALVSSENPYSDIILDRILYFMIYALAGGLSFRILLTKIFPEKRFTLRSPEGSLLKMILYAFMSASLLVIFMFIYDYFRNDPVSTGNGKELENQLMQGFFLILFVLSSVIVTPVLEEFFYRELMGKFLMERSGMDAGIIFQALFFALGHEFSVFPVIFAVGMITGIMYLKFGLRGSIITHAFYNVFIIASSLLNIKESIL